MRSAPTFWWRERPTPVARLLAPAGWAYGIATARRMSKGGTRLPVPVLCVGNFVVGGAGKTPTAIALARVLAAAGHYPAILSRGYGRVGATQAVIAVDPARHTAAEVGDEPLLLARAAPTFVGKDRIIAGRAALASGATILLLDDGLQNPALHKDATVAVVDGRLGIGNGLCVPAGPLRAPVAAQWPHVSALCLVGSGSHGAALADEARHRGTVVWQARLEPDRTAVERLSGRPLYAFAGIGQPEKFFETLRDCGLDLRGTRDFADHHRFTTDDLTSLRSEAAKQRAILVTTEKDRVRLGGEAVEVLPVRLQFNDEAAVVGWLDKQLSTPARS